MLAAASLPGCKRFHSASPPRHHKQSAPPPAPLYFSVPTFHHTGPAPGSDGRILPFPWRGNHSLQLPTLLDITKPCDSSAPHCDVTICFIKPDSDYHDSTCRSGDAPCPPQCKNPVRLLGFCHPEFSKRSGKRLFFSYFGPRGLRNLIQLRD